jgi:DNA-binding MarR family transcriptional regulator
MPDAPSFDPIAEAFTQWAARWPEQADHMAAVTSVIRVQQLLLARVEDALKPYSLTFAAYETLRLLAFTRSGSLPMGKMGTRLMVHPAAVTNAVSKLEQRGLVRRQMSPADRRVVLASITGEGRILVEEATIALNQAAFGLPGMSPGQAADVTAMMRTVRAAVGDVDAGCLSHDQRSRTGTATSISSSPPGRPHPPPSPSAGPCGPRSRSNAPAFPGGRVTAGP